MSENKQLDQWELKLEEHLKILKECQQEHHLNSCMSCDKLLECQTRDQYVVAVYESMNKGSGGGFEF